MMVVIAWKIPIVGLPVDLQGKKVNFLEIILNESIDDTNDEIFTQDKTLCTNSSYPAFHR